MKRVMGFGIVVLVCALAVGCASAGMKVRHVTTVSIASAHQVLSVVQDTEKTLVCGTAGAPPTGQCVTPEKHKAISAKLVTAFDYDGSAARIVRAWDPTQPIPSNLGELIGKITTIVGEILAEIPESAFKQKLLTLIGTTN